jgi:hypothetical protein
MTGTFEDLISDRPHLPPERMRDKVPAPEATVLQESTDIRTSSLQPCTCTTATALTALIMQKNRLQLLLLCCVEGS